MAVAPPTGVAQRQQKHLLDPVQDEDTKVFKILFYNYFGESQTSRFILF